MKFIKMQALGNDFIVTHVNENLSESQIKYICDRHLGIGADGFIVVSKIDIQTFKMEYWNADGSRAEMCGNGLRCAIRYSAENSIVKTDSLKVITDVGILKGLIKKNSKDIEAQIAKINLIGKVNISGKTYQKVDAGNPHAVTFINSVKKLNVSEIGPSIENHRAFPRKTNVEFVEIQDDKIVLRVWERGVGETLACGTGMVAAGYCAQKLSKLEFPLKVEVPGGQATVWMDDEDYMRINGPAKTVFTGEIHI